MGNTTFEGKKKRQNGVIRLVFSILSILLQVVFIVSIFTRLNAYAVWIDSVASILAFVLVLKIYGSDKLSTIKTPWIILILVFPIMGSVLYCLVGLNGGTWKMRARYAEIDAKLLPMLPDNESAADALRNRLPRAYGIAAYIKRNSGYPVYADTPITYYSEAAKGLKAQLRDLACAQRYIFMEYHAIEDDKAWQQIQNVLVERVAAGVEVYVFYDDMGSIGFVNMDFAHKLQGFGIKCKVFNPVNPALNMFLNNRDHRKITVIDGRVGYTGGYNLANEYFGITHPYGMWKDTGICIEGAAVRSLIITFLEMWNAGGRDLISDEKITEYLKYADEALSDTEPAGAEEFPLEITFETKVGEPQKGNDEACLNADVNIYCGSNSKGCAKDNNRDYESRHTAFVQPYADSPLNKEKLGEDVYISMVNSAERYCWFMTPYLIITDEMSHALGLAAKRGVDVRIITPGIPDKKLIYRVTRSFYNGLVKNGVRIYEWTPGFCHAKMSVADDCMATCGTINLDYRSLYHHFENGCFIADSEAVNEIRADMESVMEEGREVTEQYRDGRRAYLMLIDLFLRLFAQLL